MPSAAAAFEFLTQVTTIFKRGAQRHALMRYAQFPPSGLLSVVGVGGVGISFRVRSMIPLVFFANKRFSPNSNFVTGARIAVLLCTETTQKIYRGGAEVDFFSRSRYYNKNYGYHSTSDEGYFFSGTVDNYESNEDC